ncbi:unnamed protein product [Cuscuta campestris]|uniref:Reverse transcriptase domain-containing protein n=1 Tax=Cuscuta campestris TaxID=132261 RepID=A0A484L4R6_9ASTE|nr:unnamed protein product [Cuscuta campestris]
MTGGMKGLATKLRGLKPILKAWSKETFGDIFQAVKDAESKAMKAQEDFEGNPRDELRTLANKANAELIETTNTETQYWKQKAHIKWMELGDQSTSYFHSYVKGRRRSALKITSILDGNGKKTLEVEAIKKEAEVYFKEVFSASKNIDPGHILDHIPNLISLEDNNFMCRIPDEEEIKQAVWDLNPNSAAGPDGFNGDPLSPLLFIIASEVFSRMIKTSMERKCIQRFNTGRNFLVSHLAYADDLIIFLRGGIRNFLKFRALIKEYTEGSGQEVNYNKSRFYVGRKQSAESYGKAHPH